MTNTPKGAEGDVRPPCGNTKAPATGIAKASEGTGTGTREHSTPVEAKSPPEGDGAQERALRDLADALGGRDPRVALWARTGRRVPGATREFSRYDRRARNGILTMSAGLAAAMLTSSVWGWRGGRAAINQAMQLASRLPRKRRGEASRSVPRWFLAFGVAFNDGGRIAHRMIESPRRMAETESRGWGAREARTKVVARIRRELPEAWRHAARWPWLPFLVGEVGAPEATLAIRRGLREGLNLQDLERRLIHLWRRHTTRAQYRQQGIELPDAIVDDLIAQNFSDGGAK